MAASAKPKDRDLVAEAARAALDAAGGDVREATRALELSVRGNRRLRDELTDPLLATACYTAVTAQCRVERRKVWTPPVERLVANRTTGSHRVVQLAAGTLLMFPLPGGKKLGDATREEISEAAGFYEAQAGDMATKARWLRLVAQSVPGEKRAGEALTEKRLRELQEAARHA